MAKITAPKYQALAQFFTERIRNGELQPGDRLPSFTQMRAQFGATPATVERLYAQLEREKLIERRHRSGVFVTDAQQKKTLTGTIGFVALRFGQRQLHPYNHHLLQGILQVLNTAGMQIMLLDDSAITANRDKVDGLLIYEHVLDKFFAYQQSGIPCVSLVKHAAGMPAVTADDFGGGYAAARHLLELGHRRITAIMGTDLTDIGDALGEQRLAGYRTALLEAGITFEDAWVRPVQYNPLENYAERGYTAMTRWLEEGWRELGSRAILSQNDEVAIGIINALRDHSLQTPSDVSVIGFDGVGVDAHFSPRLTTVEVPLEEIGMQGARLLLQMIRDGNIDREMHQILPTQLRQSQSSAPVFRTQHCVLSYRN